MNTSLIRLLVLVTGVITSSAFGAVRLPAVLGDAMVLQRDLPVRIWGWADPGEAVAVRFAGQSASSTADADGSWSVTLDPMPASATGRTLQVVASNTIELQDVLVGEVWLCSGQSNIAWTVQQSRDAEAELASADYPQIRLLAVQRAVADAPRADITGQWSPVTPTSVDDFSAVGYFFGRRLHRELGVPVGLIESSWGGTPAEAWTSRAALDSEPAVQGVLERWDRQVQTYAERLAAWEREVANLPADAERPRKPHGDPADSDRPANLYYAMIAPLTPLTLRGVIWYQGESNASRHEQYRKLLPLMIDDWRSRWGRELPFGVVQLASYRPVQSEPSDPTWAHLRDAQLQTAREVPGVGLAVAIDIGEPDDIHPKNKQDVGYRLAQWALASVYDQKVVPGSPEPVAHRIEDGAVFIEFRHTGTGLAVRGGGKLAEFALAGEDQQWHWAQAEIVSPTTVRVWSDAVPDPVSVRYAWSQTPAHPNLVNSANLPATPFRTDDWPRAEAH